MWHFVYKPIGEVAKVIHAILLVKITKEEMQVEKILPNMSNALIIQYGDPTYYSFDGIIFHQFPRYYFALAAASKKSIFMKNSGNSQSMMVIFKPGIFYSTFGFPISECNQNLFPEPEVILGIDGLQFCRRITDPDLDDNTRLQLCANFFSRFANLPGTSLLSLQAVQKIVEKRGFVSIPEVTNYLNATKRTLNRRFLAEQGISPYTYARIVRCHAALDMIRSQRFGWQDVVHHFQYFDQSHFIRDFKELTGLSPGEYIKNDFQLERFIRESGNF
ncbi:MAG: helix-turn-helix domain-containing protein [Bacteroidales bacterium]